MTRPVLLLARLNEADLAVDAIKVRLAEIAAALREPAELLAARQAAELAEAEVTRLGEAQRGQESEQATIAADMRKIERRLYSGEVKSSRELQDSERDLEQHRRRKAVVDDELLEIMVAMEAAVATAGQATEQVSRLAADWTSRQAALRAELAGLRSRLPGEQARQASARQAVPADVLRIYDALRPRRGGRAVAELDGDECSACLVAVPPSKLETARFGDELVYCGNCGRLIWGE